MILLVAVVCAGATLGLSALQTPMYEASIKILVGQERGSNAPGSLGGDVQGLQQLTQTMAESIDTRPVAEAVIGQLNLPVTPEDFLEKYLSVDQVKATQLIEVKYRDSNPQRAQQAADNIGDVFSEQVSQVNPSGDATTATVWERAKVPDEPVTPNILYNTALALIVGLALGVGLAFLLEYLDDSWRSSEEAEQISGVPTFGAIPRFEISNATFRNSSSRKARGSASK